MVEFSALLRLSSSKNLLKLLVAFSLGVVCALPLYLFPRGYLAEFFILTPRDGGKAGHLFTSQGFMWEVTHTMGGGAFNRQGIIGCSDKRLRPFGGPVISARLENRFDRVIRVAITQKEESLALDCGEKLMKAILEKAEIDKKAKLKVLALADYPSEISIGNPDQPEFTSDYFRQLQQVTRDVVGLRLGEDAYRIGKAEIRVIGRQVSDLQSQRNAPTILVTGGFLGILVGAVALVFFEVVFNGARRPEKGALR